MRERPGAVQVLSSSASSLAFSILSFPLPVPNSSLFLTVRTLSLAKEHDVFCKSYLEEREAPVVLEQDAAGTPDITGLCPAQLCRESKASPVLPAAPTTPPSSRPLPPRAAHQESLRGGGSAGWPQSWCGARGRRWRFQNQPRGCLCSGWIFPRSSASKGESLGAFSSWFRL